MPDDISLEPVGGFSKFKRRLEGEKILHILHGIGCQIFVSVSFVFSLNFSISFIFRSIKLTLKASFSAFCLLEIIVRTFVSLITKSEVCKVFSL